MTQPSLTSVYSLYIFLLMICGTLGSPDESCFSTDQQPYLFFGSQTAYEVARNPQGIPVVPDCKPLQVWMVARHGPYWRSPTETTPYTNLLDLRDQVISNHERGRGSLCNADLESLRDWRQFLVSSAEEDSLIPQGRRDAFALGARIRQAFYTLVGGSNPSSDFVFRHTEMHKTKETAEYFAKGLLGVDFHPDFPVPGGDDRLIEGFENCPAWSRKNEKTQEKVDLYVKGPQMLEVHHNVSLRLGFNYDLPHYAVAAMHSACSYEKTWALESSPAWCSAFTPSELKVMEYLEDLKFYYRTGYGDRTGMNRRLGCPLVRDMINRFTDVERNPTGRHPAGVFYFSQAETVGLVATRLGLLADRRHQTTASYLANSRRRYRSSALLPLGANLLAAFYQCSVGERYRVLFTVSEHVVDYPGCPGGLCPWSLIKHKFTRVVRSAGCSDDFCFHTPHFWQELSNVELWAIIAVISTVLFVIHLIRAVNKLVA